jgi:hypothetical protein
MRTEKYGNNICMGTFVYNVAPCHLGTMLFAFALAFVMPGAKCFVTKQYICLLKHAVHIKTETNVIKYNCLLFPLCSQIKFLTLYNSLCRFNFISYYNHERKVLRIHLQRKYILRIMFSLGGEIFV